VYITGQDPLILRPRSWGEDHSEQMKLVSLYRDIIQYKEQFERDDSGRAGFFYNTIKNNLQELAAANAKLRRAGQHEFEDVRRISEESSELSVSEASEGDEGDSSGSDYGPGVTVSSSSFHPTGLHAAVQKQSLMGMGKGSVMGKRFQRMMHKYVRDHPTEDPPSGEFPLGGLGEMSALRVHDQNLRDLRESEARATQRAYASKRARLGARVAATVMEQRKPSRGKAQDVVDAHIQNVDEMMRKSQIIVMVGEGYAETQKVFNGNVMRMEAPPNQLIIRQPDRHHVETLKARMKKRPFASHLPWLCVVKELEDPADFDIKKMEEYTLWPIGGLNSMTASKELVQGKSLEESVGVVSAWQYRQVYLLANNLTNLQFKQLGNLHNSDNEYRKHLTFMEKTNIFRDTWVERGRPEQSDKPAYSSWKNDCLDIIDADKTGKNAYSQADLNRNSTYFQTAQWPDDCWDLLKEIEEMYQDFSLKGMKKPKRKKKQTEEVPVKGLGATAITKLNGLPPAKLYNILMKVKNKDSTLNEAAVDAVAEKRYIRTVQAACRIAGYQNVEQTEQILGRSLLVSQGNIYKQFFSSQQADENVPGAFAKAILYQKGRATEREQRAQAVIAGGGNEQDVDAQFCHVMTFSAVLLDESQFRAETPETYKQMAESNHLTNTVVMLRDDCRVMKQFEEGGIIQRESSGKISEEIKSFHFQLVIIDPPYGLTNEDWDTGWKDEEFRQMFEVLMNKNPLDGFNVVIFCSATMISDILHLLKYLSTNNSNPWEIKTQHAVWYKEGGYDTRKLYIYFVNSCSFWFFLMCIYILVKIF
jgi:hypothetical protein